ncbi:MAG: GntR family transcriptional regulator [Pseudomonadota bacterium]|nr:GntR family transcriptional regulator [Pseudomonadota bacterium]
MSTRSQDLEKLSVSRAGLKLSLRAKLGRPRTATSIIHEELRREIVGLVRIPGDVVSEKEIAAAYGVSRTPVREAILKLADERLVETFPQFGTFVSRIPVAGLFEAILVRTALERLTTRIATQKSDATAIDNIAAKIKDQRRAAKIQDRNAFHNADEAFHEAIAIAAGHVGIWRIVQTIKFQVDRYRRLTLPAPGRMMKVIKEHEAVLKCIKQGDALTAEESMAAHLAALASFDDVGHINPNYLFREKGEA